MIPTFAVHMRVAVDGCLTSLAALSYVNTLFSSDSTPKIYMLHVREWSDEGGESGDEALVSQMEQKA
jgi:hypothetical protein